jgi:hypothetical protein
MSNKVAFPKIIFLLALISTLGIIPAFAQYKNVAPEELWVCPVFETNFFSLNNAAFGGGAALGYGNKMSFGLKVVYCKDLQGVSTLELNFLVRLYLSVFFQPESAGSSGLFIQFSGGPAIFGKNNNNIAVPAGIGSFSAGLSLGWRFPFGRFFFIEPLIRGGYPYIVGAGLSAGVRF